jgi:hypothetical protein
MRVEQVTSIDDDDEWEDNVAQLSTGVRDILVTGRVSLTLHFYYGRRKASLVSSASRQIRSKAMHGAISQFLAG